VSERIKTCPVAYASVSARTHISTRLEFLLRVQRQLIHALEQLIGGETRKVLEHQLFHVQAHQVAQLQGAVACSELNFAATGVAGMRLSKLVAKAAIRE
jgi:hypothetical protein